jgi:hypothetical protein
VTEKLPKQQGFKEHTRRDFHSVLSLSRRIGGDVYHDVEQVSAITGLVM